MADLEEKILQVVKEFANGDLEIFDYKGLSKFIAESLSLPSVMVHHATVSASPCGVDAVYDDWYKCSNCGSEDILRKMKHCPNCGGKIEWPN